MPRILKLLRRAPRRSSVGGVGKFVMGLPGHRKARLATRKAQKFYGAGAGDAKFRGKMRRSQYHETREFLSGKIRSSRKKVRSGRERAKPVLAYYKQKAARLQRREVQARRIGRQIVRKQAARRSSGIRGMRVLAKKLR